MANDEIENVPIQSETQFVKSKLANCFIVFAGTLIEIVAHIFLNR